MNDTMKADDTGKIITTGTGIAPEPGSHRQLIEVICNDVLPNMVRLYESKKMYSALDRDQFVTLIEQKVERANKSLKVLPVEEQCIYRAKIDRAYEENIDRLHEIPEWRKPGYRG
jgi:hypothetical protein